MYRFRPLRCLANLASASRCHVAAARYATKSVEDAKSPRAGDKSTKNPDKLKPKITLLTPDGATMVVTLEEAEKMSRRREMKLQKVVEGDAKSQRATYRLMTNAEFKEQLKSHVGSDSDEKPDKRQVKGEKLLQITNKIGDHDLQARIKNLTKWLGRKYRVVTVISGANVDSAASERIFREIETNTKSLGKIVQKRTKGSDIRFQIHPTDPEEASKGS